MKNWVTWWLIAECVVSRCYYTPVEGSSENGGTVARRLMLFSCWQLHNFWEEPWLFVQGNSYRCCEYYRLPFYQCENGWTGTFFLQLLLSLNMNIHLENIQDTNKIFKQYWAGCCSLQKLKYYYVLSAAGAGFKKIGKEKYFSFCSRPNVQLLGNTLGLLVKITLGCIFCHYLGKAAWLNEFL